jgi:hypothetical protein
VRAASWPLRTNKRTLAHGPIDDEGLTCGGSLSLCGRYRINLQLCKLAQLHKV